MSLPIVTAADVARHNTSEDLWVLVDGVAYDLTKFQRLHPGGALFLRQLGGQDASTDFHALHRSAVLDRFKGLRVGRLASTAAAADQGEAQLSLVPYSEADGLLNHSPFYNDSHCRFLLAVREFVNREILPIAATSDELGKPPSAELFRKMGEFGLLACRLGPGDWLKWVPGGLPGGVKPEEFDHFHESIATEELARMVCPGFTDGLGTGLLIGLPPVMFFGRPELSERVGRECVLGEKTICLAVSEPQAGSDVARLTTTARREGDFYVVNGLKKWITNGAFADYFVTAVRTGVEGMRGISFLLIPRCEGITTKKIKTAYGASAGTSYVLFDEVRVPVCNLLGQENEGFQCIMLNFNHERWAIALGVCRASRAVIEECFKWTQQREVFGKPLIDQPVIRAKLAHMVAQNEAVHAWVERITYQLDKTPLLEQVKLAGPISLLKLATTRASLAIAEQACQIFGGRAITKTGMGQLVERFQRSVKFTAIYGGSEEILGDMAIRMATKQFPKEAKL